jgi:hypothetical protein
VREPRLLLDARLLGALHSELVPRLGAEQARATLLQMGFLHGLRDACRVLAASFTRFERCGSHAPPTAPLLALRFETRLPAALPGSLEIAGSWPEQHEAASRLASVGPADTPCCHVSAGYTSGWLSGLLDADVLAIETSCSVRGELTCRFAAREAPAWREGGDARALALLAQLPFESLREALARERAEAEEQSEEREGFEPDSPVVHVWGPLMVLPYSGDSETLRALDLIRSDPAARDVSVVVLDLAGALIDTGMGRSALGRVLEAIESAGAETILAGVSPLSEPVVRELERSHLLLRRELPFAIPAAFQLAEARRRAV